MNSTLQILLFIFSALPLYTYAQNSNFDVVSLCEDEYEMDCKVFIIRESKKKLLLDEVKSPSIKKINDDLFHVITSCGSPCVSHFFIDKKGEDYTNEFISVDPKSKCIIESDSKAMKIYAKRIFFDKKIVLVDLAKERFNILPSKFNYYSDFDEMSYFDGHGNLNLIANNYGKVLFKKKIMNPCGSIKR